MSMVRSAVGTDDGRSESAVGTCNALEPGRKAAKLADRMGVTTHVSPLRFKIRRLMRECHVPATLLLEDWLVELANRRGYRVVFLAQSMPADACFSGSEVLSDEELIVAMGQLNCADRPQTLRLAAQMISRNNFNMDKLLRMMRMERATRVFKELAEQALKVDPEHPAWLSLRQALRNEMTLREPLMHWTRLAEPMFAPRTTRHLGWKLVS